MHPILRNTLAVIAGIVLGSIANMGMLNISGTFIAPPPGIDPTDMKSLHDNIHLFEPKHFLFPFLAHALGTFIGALAAAFFAANRKNLFALVIGGWFMLGGIASIFMLPAPTWFVVTDLALAYLPMAFIAGRLVAGRAAKPELI
jgi:hypothetical protein